AVLIAAAGAREIFLDVPSVNAEAVALAREHELLPGFETARMYTGAIRPLTLERGFGVTTFELRCYGRLWDAGGGKMNGHAAAAQQAQSTLRESFVAQVSSPRAAALGQVWPLAQGYEQRPLLHEFCAQSTEPQAAAACSPIREQCLRLG